MTEDDRGKERAKVGARVNGKARFDDKTNKTNGGKEWSADSREGEGWGEEEGRE